MVSWPDKILHSVCAWFRQRRRRNVVMRFCVRACLFRLHKVLGSGLFVCFLRRRRLVVPLQAEHAYEWLALCSGCKQKSS